LREVIKLTDLEIKSLILKNPKYLDHKAHERIVETVTWLREQSLSIEEIFQILLRPSKILSYNLENKIKPLIKYIQQEKPFGDCTIREILLNHWSIVNFSVDKIKDRFERLKSTGMKTISSHHVTMRAKSFEALISSRKASVVEDPGAVTCFGSAHSLNFGAFTKTI
jgi:hypothetical protein